jgi:ribose 5-phosphate isomerase B
MVEMRIAVGSDERTELTDAVIAELVQRDMELELHGALTRGDDPNWPVVASAVASRVASGDIPQGILFRWTGSGVSMAANADGARRWNDANILAMSLRGVSIAVASEILDAWFAGQSDDSERANIALLKGMDCREGELTPFAATANQIGGVQ